MINDTNRTIPSWDSYFLQLAALISTRSKDRSVQVGAVIVDCMHNVISSGYNGFARGIDDDVDSRHERPTKYLWIVHAEENAILAAARSGHSTLNCLLYCTHPPCSRCARGIIQAGIVGVYYPDCVTIPTMISDLAVGKGMLDEARVRRVVVK